MGTVDADGQAHLQLRTSHSDAETTIDESLVGDSSRPSCGALTLKKTSAHGTSKAPPSGSYSTLTWAHAAFPRSDS